MPLSPDEAVEQTRLMFDLRNQEKSRLDRIRDYLRDDADRRLPSLPTSAPIEVHQLARVSRVNMLKFVVNSRVQSMYVDGFRVPRQSDDAPSWDVWQRNRMDARQIGVHRAALGYGASYVTVLPGAPVPVMRGASPRHMTVAYDDDDDWPAFALEKRRNGRWRLLDEEFAYLLSTSEDDSDRLALEGSQRHGATFQGEPVTPVVRFRDTLDLDDPVMGLVEPLTPLQDQIDITTFGLQVAQHYGAFRQRYILGWIAENEEQKLRASASKLWTFEDHPNDIEVGEFQQTDPRGYIESREATLRHLATVSQTPAHELLGQMINLSAEALAAAESSQRRAITENQTTLGESHEQALALAGEMQGLDIDPSAEVVWRDTESRSLAQVADALGKLVQQLGVPPQELWEKIPGVTQNEIERWRAAAEEGDALTNLTAMLERQANEPASAEPQPAGV